MLGAGLMFTRLLFDTEPPMAHSDHLVGALIVTVAVMAMTEAGRILRFIMSCSVRGSSWRLGYSRARDVRRVGGCCGRRRCHCVKPAGAALALESATEAGIDISCNNARGSKSQQADYSNVGHSGI